MSQLLPSKYNLIKTLFVFCHDCAPDLTEQFRIWTEELYELQLEEVQTVDSMFIKDKN